MNDVSLRDYIDTRFKGIELQITEQSNYVKQHFDLNDKAAQKSEEALLVRLDSMNQFREQINMERGDYVTKEMQAIRAKAVDDRLQKLEMASSFSSGKMWMVMAGFAAVPTIVGLAALILAWIK